MPNVKDSELNGRIVCIRKYFIRTLTKKPVYIFTIRNLDDRQSEDEEEPQSHGCRRHLCQVLSMKNLSGLVILLTHN